MRQDWQQVTLSDTDWWGAFGNDQDWIVDAIRRAVRIYYQYELDVKVVSFRQSQASIRKLCEEPLK